MPQALPSLALLSLNEHKAEACPVNASWQWDGASYQVRFSIETAFEEQIDGLGTRTDNLVFVKATGRPKPHQLSAFGLLQALIEFTVQKLWDLECTVPNLNLDEADVQKPDPAGSDNNEPFPDTAQGLILQVARMAVDVERTLTKEKAMLGKKQRDRATSAARRRTADGGGDDDDDEGDDDEGDDDEGDDDEGDDDEGDDDEGDDDEGDDDAAASENEGSVQEQEGMDDDAEEPAFGILVERQVNIITDKIKGLQAANKYRRQSLLSTLVDLQQEMVEALEAAPADSQEMPEDTEAKIAKFIVLQKDSLLEIPMHEVRTRPRPTYATKRRVDEQKLIQWCKMRLVLVDGSGTESPDSYYDEPVRHITAVPVTLDGSFFTGNVDFSKSAEDRVDKLTLEHVIATDHMKNCKLVMEFGDPEHLAMLTVFSQSTDNSSKGDRYIPLGYSDTAYSNMSRHTNSVYAPSVREFDLHRRAMAARIVCAGYLSLFMLERKPDANTEIGGRYGGLYFTYRDDVFKLMQYVDMRSLANAKLYAKAQTLTNDDANKRLLIRREWTWEAGLSLLRWHYLTQPYNPLPNTMYRAAARRPSPSKESSLRPFYEDLISRRFLNIDIMSEIMRREMQQEVQNAPLRTRKLSLDDAENRAAALAELKAAHPFTRAQQPRRNVRPRRGLSG